MLTFVGKFPEQPLLEVISLFYVLYGHELPRLTAGMCLTLVYIIVKKLNQFLAEYKGHLNRGNDI
jgi:hypothetical protein